MRNSQLLRKSKSLDNPFLRVTSDVFAVQLCLTGTSLSFQLLLWACDIPHSVTWFPIPFFQMCCSAYYLLDFKNNSGNEFCSTPLTSVPKPERQQGYLKIASPLILIVSHSSHLCVLCSIQCTTRKLKNLTSNYIGLDERNKSQKN